MNRRPLIAIVPSPHDSEKNKNQFVMRSSYFNAVYLSGGLPVYIPYTTDEKILNSYCEDFDGFLFSGGVDLDPKYFGEVKEYDSVVINKERDDFEFALFNLIYPLKKPVFGICRGIQFFNVALGGSLYQHIDNHTQKGNGDICAQKITVQKNTKLYKILGKTEIFTNSFHHQVIKKLAKPLIASAHSEDGYVEAVELPSEKHPFFMAVQWHPELFFHKDKEQFALFENFVNACKN